MTYIEGLSLGGYRSFGAAAQRMGPFQSVNLFAGPNNCGKSNILLFLANHLEWALTASRGGGAASKLKELDVHIGSSPATFTFGLGTAELGSTLNEADLNERKVTECITSLQNARTLTGGSDLAWFEYKGEKAGADLKCPTELIDELVEENVLSTNEWEFLRRTVLKRQGGSLKEHWIPETLNRISPIRSAYPRVSFIPAIREIGAASTGEHIYNGAGLIEELAKLQNPPHNKQNDKARFKQINRFVQTVTQNTTATLEIPHDRATIIVHMDNKALPIQSLGTGIHEVVIMAATATVLEKEIICIEEPEIHLHPILQRHLLAYLAENTTNQYFIATHSAHLLDAPDTAVFRVSLEDGQTRVSKAQTPADKFEICRALGYRASDLLQSNAVIWVEGPSDRIYLNHWIHNLDPDLVEGLHYSIMFYGGRLLNHLSVNDPEIDEFISLRRLNRNLVLIMDSDRSSVGKRINMTKKRIRKEFDDGPGFAWVTAGREIENYVEESTLRDAVEAVRPTAGRRVKTGQFDKAIPRINPRKITSPTIDKIKIAYEVVNRPPILDVLDLSKMLRQLVEFIRAANE